MSENLQDSVKKAVSASSVSNSTSNFTPTMKDPQVLKYSYQKPQMNNPQYILEHGTVDLSSNDNSEKKKN